MLPGAERCAPAAPSRVQPCRLPGELPVPATGIGYCARTADNQHRYRHRVQRTECREPGTEQRVPGTGTANGAPDAALQGPVSVRWAPHPRRRAPATGCSPVAVPARPPARRSPRPPAAVLISEPPRASGNTRGCSGRAGGSAAP